MKLAKPACASALAEGSLSRLFAVFALACIAGFLALRPAFAEFSDAHAPQGIVAIVNDQIISRYDLDQRVRLVMATSGIPNTPENMERIQGQVLRSLVDEVLELQEAKRLDLLVTPDDTKKELDQIAARASMTPEQIDEFLKENGVSKNALVRQIEANIAWNKVIGQQFGPLITIGEAEIDDVLNRLKSEADQPRFLVSEILLTFDNPAQEGEIAAGAQRLVEQMRQGAPFAAVARQFSQSATAANGGDIGWVHASQLPEEIAPTVEQMNMGDISDPIRTVNGFYIVQLRSRQNGLGPDPMRDRYTLVHVLLPLSADAPRALVERRVSEAEKFVKEFKSCDQVPEQVKQFVGGIAQAPREVAAGQLDQRMRDNLMKSKPGDILPPIRSAQGIEMVVVCGHEADKTALPTRDAVEDNLFSQQLSMMARRHLRDLRRDAVIDIR